MVPERSSTSFVPAVEVVTAAATTRIESTRNVVERPVIAASLYDPGAAAPPSSGEKKGPAGVGRKKGG